MRKLISHSAFIFFLILAACDPLFTDIKDNHALVIKSSYGEVDTLDVSDTLKLLTWNIKFAGARANFYDDCHGDQVHMLKTEVVQNLNNLIQIIQRIDPDVVFLQEVDHSSKRSAYVDEVRYLLDGTKLTHAYYAPEWKGDYIPVDGLGRINSGNAILTKAKIKSSKFVQIEQPNGLSKTEAYFYNTPNIGIAEVELKNGESIFFVTSRFSQFAKDGTKAKQLATLQSEMKKLTDLGNRVIFGGCLYLLPPETEKLEDYEDEICTDPRFMMADYTEETEIMLPMYEAWNPAISLRRYFIQNSKFFTYSRSEDYFWNRKLDYFFSDIPFMEHSDTIYQSEAVGGLETMPYSDHAPFSVSYIIK